MKRGLAAMAATALLGLASISDAEIRPKSYSFSPFLGGYTFEGEQHIETDLVFGARFGYDYSRRVGVEALMDFGQFQTTEAVPKRDVRLFTAGIEGLYHFYPDGRLVPFLAGGGRLVNVNDADDEWDKTRFGVAYGAGAKYFLAPDLALRADVRHILQFNHGLNNLEYTLGLSWIFGGKAAPAPAPAPAAAPPPPAAPTATITAIPASIEAGKCSNLSWNATNATGGKIEPGIGTVDPAGSRQVCPPSSTIYTFTASGPGGSASSTASVGVTQPPPPPPVPAPEVSISANPASIEAGKCTTLTWSSANAASISIEPGLGTVSPSGTKQVCPASTTGYTITGSGAGGTRTASAQVTVNQPPPPPPPAAPTVSITVLPASIRQGECANLSWSSANATSTSIDPAIGAVPASGSREVCPPSSTVYTATATGAGGSRSASTQLAVTAPPPKEPAKEELTIVLDIEFDTDKSVVKPQYDAEVAKVAEFMRKYPQVKGVVEGHTDNVGGKAYNERLSLRRADAVKKLLVEKHGIDGSRLTTVGYGFSKPIADNGTPEGRQKNRRIVANFDKVTIVKP